MAAVRSKWQLLLCGQPRRGLWSLIAVAVHPNLEYCLVEFEGKDIWQQRAHTGIKWMLGADLVPGSFKVPSLRACLLHLSRPCRQVLNADFVSHEDGSGVYIAPGHGEEDFPLRLDNYRSMPRAGLIHRR